MKGKYQDHLKDKSVEDNNPFQEGKVVYYKTSNNLQKKS